MRRFVVFALVLTFALSSPAMASKGKGSKKTKKLKSNVVAVVNGHEITVDDYKRELKALPPQMQMLVKQDKTIRDKFLDNLVSKEILKIEAKKEKVKLSKEQQKKLEDFKNELLINALLDRHLGKIKVSDKEAAEYYREHKSEFTTPAQVRASHILVQTEKEAEDLIKRLKKGADFAKLAQQFSLDHVSAKKGGDLGYFSKDQMVKPFADAAFSLKVGQISKPVKTRFGYHIIKVTDKKRASLQPFPLVKKQIKEKLLREKQQKAFDAFLLRISKGMKITKNPDALNGRI